MQTTRELTPQEVAEGQRGINDEVLSSTQVQALVRNMDVSKKKWRKLKDDKAKYEEKLKQENQVLYFNYPSLFNLHMEDKLDSTFFEMLSLKRRIEKGEITAEQASTIVGQTLFQKFVPQAISGGAPAPKSMSYEDYYKQFSSHENK
jgi:ABC-type Fe3+-citrate transport system substrate-binding protein